MPPIIHVLIEQSRELLVRQKDTLAHEYGGRIEIHHENEINGIRRSQRGRLDAEACSAGRDAVLHSHGMGFDLRLSIDRRCHTFAPAASRVWHGLPCNHLLKTFWCREARLAMSLCLDPAARD
jgi:hypothetical protein